MIVLEMWFPSLSQLIMEFHRGPFLALFCLLLKTVPKLCQTPCYIDDSKLDLKFKTNELRNAVSAVNSDLNKICRWCCHNSLLMNPDKIKHLLDEETLLLIINSFVFSRLFYGRGYLESLRRR